MFTIARSGQPIKFGCPFALEGVLAVVLELALTSGRNAMQINVYHHIKTALAALVLALELVLVVVLPPVIHPHNRTLLSLGLYLSPIIEPYEHLCKIVRYDSHI